jgi:alpha-acetolactate decarboxylase
MRLTTTFLHKTSSEIKFTAEGKMNTKTLVVGQKAWMQSANERIEVEVEEITEKYVEVRVVYVPKGSYRYSVRFDKNSEQPDFYDPNVRDMNAHIRDWPFGVFGLVDGWSPLRLCGENGEPYVLTLTPVKHCDQ